jgi:hypothetical protein
MRALTATLVLFVSAGCGSPAGVSPRDAAVQHDATNEGDSGDTEAGIDDGGSSDGNARSDGEAGGAAITDAAAGDAAWSPVCPENPPTMGDACSTPSVLCEYGNAWWNPNCDLLFSCVGPTNATWYQSSVAGGAPCIGPPGANLSACPTSAPAGPCDAAITCFYDQGNSCECLQSADAAPQWACIPADPACGTTRPRLGSPCTDEGLVCEYVRCAYAQQCMNDVWTLAYDSCP